MNDFDEDFESFLNRTHKKAIDSLISSTNATGVLIKALNILKEKPLNLKNLEVLKPKQISKESIKPAETRIKSLFFSKCDKRSSFSLKDKETFSMFLARNVKEDFSLEIPNKHI